jgi:hypothetical protein
MTYRMKTASQMPFADATATVPTGVRNKSTATTAARNSPSGPASVDFHPSPTRSTNSSTIDDSAASQWIKSVGRSGISGSAFRTE